MEKIGGWGIPFLGCISLSSGLWAVIILGGGQVFKAVNILQESHMPSAAALTTDATTVRASVEINAVATGR